MHVEYHVEYHSTGKGQFLFSKSLLLVLKKFHFLGGTLGQAYNYIKFCHYSELS